MFYYLTVSYSIPDLSLDSSSHLFGPFVTAEHRDSEISEDLSGRDLETDEVVNVTKLKIEDNRLVVEGSFLAGTEHQSEDEDE